MYPVPALARHIEHEWAEELANHFGRSLEEVASTVRPWFGFPPGSIRVELMDGSFVEFKYSIFIVSESKRAIAVFTEHCGNHVYPYHEAKVFRDGALVYEQ
jgi:transcription antitermination factor NusG